MSTQRTCTWCCTPGHDFRAHLTPAYRRVEARFDAAFDAWCERYPDSIDAEDQAMACAKLGHPADRCVPLCKRLAAAYVALDAAIRQPPKGSEHR